MKGEIRVLLLDDHPLYRGGIRSLLDMTGRYTVVGEGSEVAEGLRIVEALHPHLALVDINLAEGSGLEFLRRMQFAGAPRCVVLSMHTSAAVVMDAFRSGASGYVTKESAGEVLLRAMETALRGELFVDEAVSGALVNDLIALQNPDRGAAGALKQLSRREAEIFELLGQGLAPEDIAISLGCSVKTIYNHRLNIMNKLGLKDVAALERFARKLRQGS